MLILTNKNTNIGYIFPMLCAHIHMSKENTHAHKIKFLKMFKKQNSECYKSNLSLPLLDKKRQTAQQLRRLATLAENQVEFFCASNSGRDLTPSSGFHKNCMYMIHTSRQYQNT